MSNKTTKQRIALVAASGLMAGFLSIVSMPAANAALGVTYDNASTGMITLTDGTLTSTSETATMAVGGQLILDFATANTQVAIVSGGTIASVGATNAATTVNASRTSVSTVGALTNVAFTPTVAGTNMVISIQEVATEALFTAATIKITVTVRAAGASGTFSLANSLISLDPVTGTTATASDTPGAEVVSYASGEASLNYALNDALGNDMPTTTVVVANVTSGSCTVGTATAPTLNFVVGEAPDDQLFVAGSADKCTVALSVNGVLATTKSYTFLGAPAKVVISGVTTAKSSTVGNQATKGYFAVTDASGTAMGGITVAADTTKYGNVVSAITLASSTTSSTDSSLGGKAGSVPTAFGVSCTGVKGTQKGMRLSTTLSTGVVIYSDPFDVSCHGGLYSYSASLDAASYTTGGISTLTISGKDSSGNPIHDGARLDNSAGALTNLSVTCGGQATPVTAVAFTDTFLGGVKKYTFALGTTVGNYNCVVSLGDYTAAGTGNTALAAATVPWSLKSATTSVSNEDVLKSIVALIASINKQIQALQKLILKR